MYTWLVPWIDNIEATLGVTRDEGAVGSRPKSRSAKWSPKHKINAVKNKWVNIAVRDLGCAAFLRLTVIFDPFEK